MSISGRQAATMVQLAMAVDVVEKYIQTQDKHHAKTTATGLVLKSGV